MKIPREEKVVLSQKIKSGEITVKQAAEKYGVTTSAIYRMLNKPIKEKQDKPYKPEKKTEDKMDISVYQNMSKDELIRELILAKANELRAKKGYEVRGDGANKEFIPLNNKNSK